jgi:hypothetical protein
MITTVRNLPVHDNSLMKTYRAIEERGLSLAFHSGVNWGENVFKGCNRFISVHALGFSFYNILHCTNWVINGMGERFPKLPVMWVEAGLAWIPFLMQRLDHEYMLRTSECPLLKKKPSDYMRDMYYSSQPMEVQDMGALETTFRMINAETQLMWSSDYPHWDFDLPTVIWDLPFLSEKAKHNILGGNAARLMKLPPRNEAQKANLKKFGNVAASLVLAATFVAREILDHRQQRPACHGDIRRDNALNRDAVHFLRQRHQRRAQGAALGGEEHMHVLQVARHLAPRDIARALHRGDR